MERSATISIFFAIQVLIRFEAWIVRVAKLTCFLVRRIVASAGAFPADRVFTHKGLS